MSDTSLQITDESAFENASLAVQIVLAVVTLGVYTIYWWYKANSQLASATDSDLDPTLQTVLFVIPLANLYAVWTFSDDAGAVIDQDSVLLFVLFVVFAPAFWFLVQSGFNDVAGA